MPSLVTVVTTPSNHVNWDHDLLADNEPQVACWWGTMNCLLVRNYQLFVGEEPWTVCRRVRHTPFMRHSWLGYHTSTVSASSHPYPCIFTKWIIASSRLPSRMTSLPNKKKNIQRSVFVDVIVGTVLGWLSRPHSSISLSPFCAFLWDGISVIEVDRIRDVFG